MFSNRFARTLVLSVSVFLLVIIPVSASNIVYDEEAERADYTDMERADAQSITHVVAEKKYEGQVTFTYNLTQPGTYRIEAKTLANDKQEDSFWVSVDGSEKAVWHVPHAKRWKWSPVSTDNMDVGLIELTAGEHTLTFHGREKTRLDRVRVYAVAVDSNDDNAEVATEPESEEDTVTEEEATPSPASPEAGNMWWVNPRGNDDDAGTKDKPFRTIQAGISAAQSGDRVLVAPGTYTETISTIRPGTAGAPITITAADANNKPVLDLKWKHDAPRIEHSYIVWEHFEIKNFDEGVRIEGASYVKLKDNNIHHGENECVRVRYGATHNLISNNRIFFCGATSPDERMERGNGEAIYIGTAPEQRDRYNGGPDQSTHNLVVGNRISDVTESVDLKEDSHYTLVSENIVYRNSDYNSGAINVRGDDNTVVNNTAYENAGSGFRFGGDRNITDPTGEKRDYGTNNVVKENTSKDNGVFGYKLMHSDQLFECSNISENNAQHLNSGGEDFLICFD